MASIKGKLRIIIVAVFLCAICPSCTEQSPKEALTLDPAEVNIQNDGEIPTIYDNNVDYSVIESGPEEALSIILDDNEERARREVIEHFQKGYDLLRGQSWETDNLDVFSNNNVQILLSAVSELLPEEIPVSTYCDILPDVIIHNFSNFTGEHLFFNSVKIISVNRIAQDDVWAKAFGLMNDFYIIECVYSDIYTLQLFVMNTSQVQEFYKVGMITSVHGWPIGVSEDGYLRLCRPKMSGG